MTTYAVRLEGREEIAAGTMAFRFDKPAGFNFKPGQAIDVVLLDQALDAKSARHTFSLVSAPFQNQVVVATRMRDSAFKRALKALPLGSAGRLEGPFGSLTLHHDRARPAVFIAGGIGITPFMSMLRQAAKDESSQRLLLLYSNPRPEDTAFLTELQEYEQKNENFRLVATMTRMSASRRPWRGETGLIDDVLITRVVAGLATPIYYLAGPPGMVEAMRQALNHARVDDDDIRSEEFYGYDGPVVATRVVDRAIR